MQIDLAFLFILIYPPFHPMITGTKRRPTAKRPAAPTRNRRSGLLNRAVVDIGSRITRGDYEPDTTLPIESELADQLGVGRNVVREAVKVLAGKGLLRTGPRVGTRVRPRSDWNLLDPDVISWSAHSTKTFEPMLRELTEVRRLFEPAAAELASKRATRREAADLLAAVERMEATVDDPKESLKADLEFHRVLLTSAHNSVLASFQNVISALLRSDFEIAMRRPGAFADSIGRHREIAEAVADRAPGRARRAAETLIDENWQDVESVLSTKGEPRSRPRRRKR